jgi:hypothetical protein
MSLNDGPARAKREIWTPPSSAGFRGGNLPEVWIPKSPGKKGTPQNKAWAMENFLVLVGHGYNFTQAAERLGYSYRWWAQLSQQEPEWAEQARQISTSEIAVLETPDLSGMPFGEFCERYAGFTLAEHQLRIEEALQDPLAKVVLILGHPESGKSTIVSLWYVLYCLARDFDERTAIVTKNSTKAQDLLTRIKRYLTEEHLYDNSPSNLIVDFNGWKPLHGDMEWSQNQIFIRHRKSGERDPSVQALGIGKLIYGSRLDHLILDDALVQDNQISEVSRERIDNWFDGEARSRAQKGQTIVNGTRLIPQDLYGQWKKAWKENRLVRQVIIPAILDEHTENERVSWPEYWTLDGYDIEEEFDMKDGTTKKMVTGYQMGMRDMRDLLSRKSIQRWKLIYQQEDVEEGTAIFSQALIDNALELGKTRQLGQVLTHERLVLGIDPATTGRAAAVLLAVDPITKVRTVVDIFIGSHLGATGIREKLMYEFWEKYRRLHHSVDVTVIETNFAKTLLGDTTLVRRAQEAGTQLVDHHTTGRGRRRNKWDEEFGIASISGQMGSGLLAFANGGPEDMEKLQGLIDDLKVFPYSDPTGDALMALWVGLGEADSAQYVPINQAEVAKRRGAPGVVTRRARR